MANTPKCIFYPEVHAGWHVYAAPIQNLHTRRRRGGPLQWRSLCRRLRVAARCSGPPSPPASPPVAVAETASAAQPGELPAACGGGSGGAAADPSASPPVAVAEAAPAAQPGKAAQK